MPDKYGCFRNTGEDFDSLAKLLKDSLGVPVLFPYSYSYDEQTCLIILIVPTFIRAGTFPFGGNPNGRVYVGVYGRGCTHLGWEHEMHPSYAEEKLDLGHEDARGFAELWNALRERLKHVQIPQENSAVL